MKKIVCLIALMLVLICVLASCNFDWIQQIKDDNWGVNFEKYEEDTQEEKNEEESQDEKGELTVPSDENLLGLEFFLKDDATYVVEIGQAKYLSKIEIPATYKGKAVTEIGNFQSSNLKEVIVPDGIRNIDDSAFSNCSALTSIVLPDSITSIGRGAFSGCNSLESITLPFVGANKAGTNNTHVGYVFGAASPEANANYVPTSLKTVVVARETSIWDSAFRDCSSLTGITLSDSITNIGSNAFYGCSSLTSIRIPDSVESIGERAFEECTALTSITLPFIGDKKEEPTVTQLSYIFGTIPSSLQIAIVTEGSNVPEKAFYKCSSIESVMFLNNITSIGDSAFTYCSALKRVTMPETVTSIGKNAFAHCSELTNIAIPENVTSIGDYAFYGCSSLTGIIIPDSMIYLGNYSFAFCRKLSSVVLGSCLENIGANAFRNCPQLASLKIGNSITCIGEYAFLGCSALTNVTIPSSVTSIEFGAFGNCEQLTDVTFVIPSAWWYASHQDATSGTAISAIYLSDPSIAAEFLKSTYCNHYWFCTEQ